MRCNCTLLTLVSCQPVASAWYVTCMLFVVCDSNMQFSIGLGGNASSEAQRANLYPTIRLFTVAHSSKWSFDQVGAHGKYPYPLRDLLHEPFQPWSVASNVSLISTEDKWGYFSSVCWFFGRRLHDGLGGEVPIGLISNNW